MKLKTILAASVLTLTAGFAQASSPIDGFVYMVSGKHSVSVIDSGQHEDFYRVAGVNVSGTSCTAEITFVPNPALDTLAVKSLSGRVEKLECSNKAESKLFTGHGNVVGRFDSNAMTMEGLIVSLWFI
ncbi:hypothetical protein J4N45_10650 [Vibrio sp. SCSIO 43140]|uniref:hypothetical protein n=1 Tax=Vibrio sp. SCSIO 43140 TaxID=2819100 RepID=UPI002074DA11|nr:hypothetical protein [Vibrio sp. SCSIO 43140]USD58990.1 hypothetical protein J4N45_10650 [Vibrio sp. SCSIO 43140]